MKADEQQFDMERVTGWRAPVNYVKLQVAIVHRPVPLPALVAGTPTRRRYPYETATCGFESSKEPTSVSEVGSLPGKNGAR